MVAVFDADRSGGVLEVADMRLGDVLIDHGVITEAQCETALATCARTGSRLGTVLIASGFATPRQVYVALAASWGADYAEVDAEDLDADILALVDLDQTLRSGWIPMHRDHDGAIVVLTSHRPSEELRTEIELTLAGRRPPRRRQRLGVVARDPARLPRRGRRPGDHGVVARRPVGVGPHRPGSTAEDQRRASRCSSLITCAVLWPRPSLSALSMIISLGFLVGIAFKFVMCMTGARMEFEAVVTPEEVAALRDDELPIYTVLVPCYREAGIVAQLVDNLGCVGLPAGQARDPAAARGRRHRDARGSQGQPAAAHRHHRRDPRRATQDQAEGLQRRSAAGQGQVPGDLRRRGPPRPRSAQAGRRRLPQGPAPATVCLQAALNYFNADENVLTRMFTLEYSILVRLHAARARRATDADPARRHLQPLRHRGACAISAAGIPSTSPRTPTSASASPLAASTSASIDSTTFEEANRAYGNWIRQRSRWIKGYMQTTLVHTPPSDPAGPRGGHSCRPSGFAMLIGGTAASFLAVIPLYAAVRRVVDRFADGSWPAISPVGCCGSACSTCCVGNGLMIWVSMMGAFRRRRYWLVLWALLNPLYWLLHSISAYKGLIQLITRPHYWEKTAHGLSTWTAPTLPRAPDQDGAILRLA